ncbi:hypothetical protein B1218_34605 [Pseudomonas ogarae]|nr:hypothetical protein B1218_34605 [Pseudomonas ogarae]
MWDVREGRWAEKRRKGKAIRTNTREGVGECGQIATGVGLGRWCVLRVGVGGQGGDGVGVEG